MHARSSETLLRLCLTGKRLAVVAFCLLFCLAGPGFAQEQPVLKPDVPKLDDRPLPQQPSPGQQGADAKPRSPLQGKVERSEQSTGALGGRASGGQVGGWGKGRSDIPRRMKAGARNDGLSSQVESGIGIIGVKFVMFMGRPPVINRVFPQTPAADMGLQINDMIIAVDGVPTYGLTKEEVYDMIVGAPGSPVTLSIKRAGDYMAVTMTRMDLNDITDPFVRRDYMMNM